MALFAPFILLEVGNHVRSPQYPPPFPPPSPTHKHNQLPRVLQRYQNKDFVNTRRGGGGGRGRGGGGCGGGGGVEGGRGEEELEKL